MRKRGQLQISFGMIFSIILIIAIVGVSIYVISYFMSLRSCTTIGFFYDDIQDRVDKAWASTKAQEIFEADLPRGIEKVCFGSFDIPHRDEDSEAFESLKRYANHNKNLFLYPNQGDCGADLRSYKLEHATSDEFFCSEVDGGEVTFKISKTSTDSLVKLSEE